MKADNSFVRRICGAQFRFLPLAEVAFTERAAVYVVIAYRNDEAWRIIDVGQMGSYGSGINAPKRRATWPELAHGAPVHVGVAFLPTHQASERERDDLEMLIAREMARQSP